jgi:hypothetical protein
MQQKIRIAVLAAMMIGGLSPYLPAQGNTDVYVSKITRAGAGWDFSAPLKISERTGYNNQPSFSPDGGGVFFASADGKQTDIFLYDLKEKKTVRLTETGDSEYSPLIMPSGKEFSVIQLILAEGPRKGAQPLLAFPLKGGSPRLLYENGKKIGYHAWIDADRAAVFVLGDPSTLQLVQIKTGEARTLAEDIGRSLFKSTAPDSEMIFFSQKGIIKKINLKTSQIEEIVPLQKGNDFFAPTPDGALFMALNAEIYGFRPGEAGGWKKIGDFSANGIKSITRIAVSAQGDRLAFVANR